MAGVRVASEGRDQVCGIDDNVVAGLEGLDLSGYIHVGVEGRDYGKDIDLAGLAAGDNVAACRGGLAEFLLEPASSTANTSIASDVCEGVAVGISIAGGLAVLVRLGSLGVGVGADVGVVAGVDIVSALRARLLGGRSDVVVGNFAGSECCGVGRVDISITTRN